MRFSIVLFPTLTVANLRRLSLTWVTSLKSALTTERQCLLFFLSPTVVSTITKEPCALFPKHWCAILATSKLILHAVKFIFSKRNGRKLWVISDQSFSYSSTMDWDTLAKAIVWKELEISTKPWCLSARQSKWIPKLWVRASWNADFCCSKWNYPSKLCKTLKS